MKKYIAEKMRLLPSVDSFIKSKAGKSISKSFGSGIAKFALRQLLDNIRNQIKAKPETEVPNNAKFAELLKNDLIRLTSPMGRKAINASGIMLHTGLGRAPYADNAVEALSVCNGYSLLQTDLASGKRSLREEKIEAMLKELTGCEAATVINNNAEATMLILNTLAKGKEAIISRGQLVEIGGSFRMPDVMKQSGAKMLEVGATNRTHIKDYAAAITQKTGAIIHVHTSNYRIRGFAGMPNIRQICEFRKKSCPNIPVVDDLGSGGLIPLSKFALPDEPLIKESISAGVDLVCFSGDKLICGPQVGIICGKADMIAKVRKNPFARMFRCGKMTLAALESTLIHFINGTYQTNLPFYQMLTRTTNSLKKDADTLLKALKKVKGYRVSIIDDVSYVGSGSVPDQGVPDKVLHIEPESGNAAKLATGLRLNIPSVFCRLKGNALLFNMRTLLNDDIDFLKTALESVLGK